MDIAFYFIVSLVLSFVSSLPLGLITLNVVQKTFHEGRYAGISLALGATVMEFIYTYIALISLDLFTQNHMIGGYIEILATIIFFAMGIYFLRKKSGGDLPEVDQYNSFDFFQGVLIGAMNILIVPFWIFVALWLMDQGMAFENTWNNLSFSLGSALGALLAFLGYVWASALIIPKLKTINQYTDKIIGVIFLGLGLFQVVQFFF